MSKHTTGPLEGQDIMFQWTYQWTYHWNPVSIHDVLDNEWRPTGKFKAKGRLRENLSYTWATDLDFPTALNLEERLVVGGDYVPPLPDDKKMVLPEFGAIVCDNMDLHQLHGDIAESYTIIPHTLVEDPKLKDFDPVSKAPNKAAVMIGHTDAVPNYTTLILGYRYDDRYFKVAVTLNT